MEEADRSGAKLSGIKREERKKKKNSSNEFAVRSGEFVSQEKGAEKQIQRYRGNN